MSISEEVDVFGVDSWHAVEFSRCGRAPRHPSVLPDRLSWGDSSNGSSLISASQIAQSSFYLARLLELYAQIVLHYSLPSPFADAFASGPLLFSATCPTLLGVFSLVKSTCFTVFAYVDQVRFDWPRMLFASGPFLLPATRPTLIGCSQRVKSLRTTIFSWTGFSAYCFGGSWDQVPPRLASDA